MSDAGEVRVRSASPATFACSPHVRRAPWVVAASLVAAGLIAASRVDPLGLLENALVVRALLVAVGAVAGFRFLLSSGEVRIRATLREKDLLLEFGGRAVTVSYESIEALDYEHAFRRYSRWPPALVIVDVRGNRHRVPSFVADGEGLVLGLVERSRRRDLGGWAEALGLRSRMGRARWLVPAAYAGAASIVLAAILA